METVPCPQGDNGRCTIPDRTAVVREGSVSLWSREKIEATFPNVDLKLREASMTPLDLPEDDIEELFSKRRSYTGPDPERVLVDEANRRGTIAAIVVQCSCGHRFMLDT